MKIKILVLVLLAFYVSNISAQIIVDLSRGEVSSETIDINLKPTLIIKNMLYPREYIKYSFSIDLDEQPVPPFSLDNLKAQPLTSSDSIDIDTVAYSIALTALKSAKDELETSKAVKNLQKEIDKLKPKYLALKQKGELAIQSTISTPKDLQFLLRNNQTIIVKVKREFLNENGKDTSITWKFTFKTPSKSPWNIMYGFTFIPNMMNPISNYYAKADTSGKLFEITKLNNDRKDFLKNISPTLMVTWKPAVKYTCKTGGLKVLLSNNVYQLGFVAGLSLNFASETGAVNVMAGPSIVIADNISLSAGVALTQKSVLKGQYKEGDIIKESLDFDQLHEKKYIGEWFVSLSIRFEQNPFSKKEDAKDK